jgi:hypothetical protein
MAAQSSILYMVLRLWSNIFIESQNPVGRSACTMNKKSFEQSLKHFLIAVSAFILFSAISMNNVYAQILKKQNRELTDVINLLVGPDEKIDLFIRKERVNFLIFGLNNLEEEKISKKIKELADIFAIESSVSNQPNLLIIVDKELFTDGIVDEVKSEKLGSPKFMIDSLRKHWRYSMGCASSSVPWGTDGIGLSVIFVSSDFDTRDVDRCIDRHLIESFGVDTENFIKCLEICFSSKIEYNAGIALKSINKCKDVVKSSKVALDIYKSMSVCFWDTYKGGL